jgi:histidine ammonia-lyase
MATSQLIAPVSAIGGVVQTRYGNSYTIGASGLVTVQVQDVDDLLKAGFLPYVPGVGGVIGKLIGANFNVTTDQSVGMLIGAGVPFRITKITVKNASVSLTTAAGGVYTAASKGGTAIVANSQVYTSLSAATLALDLTIASTPGLTVQTAGLVPILSLTTAQGAAATADVYVFGDVYL